MISVWVVGAEGLGEVGMDRSNLWNQELVMDTGFRHFVEEGLCHCTYYFPWAERAWWIYLQDLGSVSAAFAES